MGMGVPPSAVNCLLFCSQLLHQRIRLCCLRLRLYDGALFGMQDAGRSIAALHNDRADDQIIDAVPDKRQCQWGIGPDVHPIAYKFLPDCAKQAQALFHFTPSLVSSSTMPLSRSCCLISSARVKFFALRAA